MRRSVCIIMLLLALPVYADGTLRDAVERAWARQPAYQAQPARADEFAAKRDAAQSARDGAYTAPADVLAKPGQYPLVFTIRVAEETDLLSGTLTVPQPAGQSAHGRDWTEWLVWLASAFIALSGIAWLLRRRMARNALALAFIAVAVVPVLLAVATSVHADEGHGADKKGAAAYAPVGAGENATSQRLADGGEPRREKSSGRRKPQ